MIDVAQFARDGYLHLRGYLDPASLASIRRDCDDLGRESAWSGSWRKSYDTGDGFRLLTHGGIRGALPAVQALTDVGAVPLVAETLLGKPVTCVRAMLIAKPPRVGQAFPPHQDGAYYKTPADAFVIVTVYLDPQTPETGALRVLPGSHRSGLATHATEDGGKAWLPAYDVHTMVELCGDIGDVVAMTGATVHASLPNVSDQWRRILRLGYAAA